MKGFSISSCVVAVLLLAGAPAFAGSILLNSNQGFGTTAGYAMNFGPTGGGNFSVKFTSKAHGIAFGTGNLNPPLSGIYTILQNGASVNYTGVSCGASCYSLSQTGNLIFDYGTAKNKGSLLTGMLQLLNVTQTGNTGNFNENLPVNLIITGGSLASKFGSNGILQMTLAFKSGTSLANLSSQIGAWINSGTVRPASAAPEPSSLLMLGTGLVAIAGLMRKVKLFSS